MVVWPHRPVHVGRPMKTSPMHIHTKSELWAPHPIPPWITTSHTFVLSYHKEFGLHFVSSYHSPKHTQISTHASSTHFSLSWHTHTLAPPTHLNMFASRCVWYFPISLPHKPTYIYPTTPPPVPDTRSVPSVHLPTHPPPIPDTCKCP